MVRPSSAQVGPNVVAINSTAIHHVDNVSMHHSVGVIELSAQYECLNANETAYRLAGVEPVQALSLPGLLGKDAVNMIQDLLRAPDSVEIEVDLIRGDGRTIPVAISARHLTTSTQNAPLMIVIFRSLAEERLTSAVRERIRSSSSAHDIFKIIAEEIYKCVNFAHCAASVYNPDLTGARVVFGWGELTISWPSRWFALTPERADWLKQAKKEAIPNLHDFYNDPRWNSIADPDTLKAMAQLQSAFRIPVIRQGRVVASINFFRKVNDGFDDPYDLELLNSLPIDNALLMALSCLENEDLRFKADLMDQLASCSFTNMLDRSVSQTIVNHLARHYDWRAISIWQINRQTLDFELQATTDNHFFDIDPDFVPTVDKGVMGQAYQTGEIVCIGDLEANEKYKHLFKSGYKFRSLSELCVPIRIGQETVGMLNIEDSRRNAFAVTEVETITDVISDVCSLLERQRNEAIADQSFKATPSAVFVVRQDGTIDKVNPSALKMLGYHEANELQNRSLAEILEPPAVPSLLSVDTTFRDDLSLICKDGSRLKISVASSPLGNMMGAIVTARDLRSRRRIEELEGLETIFYDIASQTKLPLALTFSSLTKLKQHCEVGNTVKSRRAADELDKAIRHLRRVEITYDHLALYDKNAAGGIPTNSVVIEPAKLLDTLLGELPFSDVGRIIITGDGLKSHIIADIYQVSFILLSWISYGLRFLPESQRLSVNVGLTEDAGTQWVQFAVDVFVPSATELRKLDLAIAKVLAEMSLGARAAAAFVETNGGRLDFPQILEGVVHLRVAFPQENVG